VTAALNTPAVDLFIQRGQKSGMLEARGMVQREGEAYRLQG